MSVLSKKCWVMSCQGWWGLLQHSWLHSSPKVCGWVRGPCNPCPLDNSSLSETDDGLGQFPLDWHLSLGNWQRTWSFCSDLVACYLDYCSWCIFVSFHLSHSHHSYWLALEKSIFCLVLSFILLFFLNFFPNLYVRNWVPYFTRVSILLSWGGGDWALMVTTRYF